MKKSKQSASLIAAQQKYFEDNGIKIPEKEKESSKKVPLEITSIPKEAGLSGMKSFGIYIAGINKAKPLTYMDDRNILQAVLNHYSMVLKHIITMDKEFHSILRYIKIQCCEDGICMYSRIVLGVDICERDFIKNNSKLNGYWFETPDCCDTIDEMINCISFRVAKVKEILNSMQ